MSSLGDASFERFLQEAREAANGDEEKAIKLLTARVLIRFIMKNRGRRDHDGADLKKKLRIKIEELNGTDVTLVAEKQVSLTDLNEKENRLLIPGKKILNQFLTPDEEKQLDDKKGVRVTVIQPCLERTDNMMLKKWTMTKNKYFALIGNWSSITKNKKNCLKKGCTVRLLSFRREAELFLALDVKASKPKQKKENTACDMATGLPISGSDLDDLLISSPLKH